MTQCDRIIDYMEKFGSITQLEAFSDLGIMRLASRISDLKKAGYNITDEMVTSRNRFGDPVSFKRYKLDEK